VDATEKGDVEKPAQPTAYGAEPAETRRHSATTSALRWGGKAARVRGSSVGVGKMPRIVVKASRYIVLHQR